MIIGKYNKSVILTYIGIGLAFSGIALTVNGHIPGAMICLIFSGICDLFDGAVARRCKRDESEKEFGIQIDSLADSVNFLAFPAVLGLYLLDGVGAAKYPILLFYILCGIIRLAWFNTSAAAEGTRTHYDGLPVTYSALIFPSVWLALSFSDGAVTGIILAAAYAATAVLFVLNIKIPKPKGVWYVIFSLLAVVVTVLIIAKEAL